MTKTLVCPCSEVIVGETDDLLVESVEEHLTQMHPTRVGEYSRDEILFMAF